MVADLEIRFINSGENIICDKTQSLTIIFNLTANSNVVEEGIKMSQSIIDATKKGDFEAVRTLIENGEEIEARNHKAGRP